MWKKSKQTFEEAGYQYLASLGNREHLVRSNTNVLEVFSAYKKFNGWGLKFRNTNLMFERVCDDSETEQLKMKGKLQ